MSIQERRWEKKGIEATKIPEKTSGIPLGIFIDDVTEFAEDWEECFQVSEFGTLRADVPQGTLDDEELAQEATQILSAFMRDISEEQLKRVRVVVIDQFYDNDELGKQARIFIARLRAVNKTAIILETSGAARPALYDKDSVVLEMTDTFSARKLIGKAPSTAGARMQALEIYSKKAFLEADKVHRYDDQLLGSSYRRLIRYPKFSELESRLGQEESGIFSVFIKLNKDEKRLFLHCSWTILGQIELGNTKDIGLPLVRLKEFFTR